MRILRGGATEDAAAPVAASSTAMPGAFDLDPPADEEPRLPPVPRIHRIVCWECHHLSIGVQICHHRAAALVDNEVYGEPMSEAEGELDDTDISLASLVGYDSEGSVDDSEGSSAALAPEGAHQIQQEEVTTGPMSPYSDRSSALWVGVSPGSSFIVDHPELMHDAPSLPEAVAGAASAQPVTTVQPDLQAVPQLAFVLPQLPAASSLPPGLPPPPGVTATSPPPIPGTPSASTHPVPAAVQPTLAAAAQAQPALQPHATRTLVNAHLAQYDIFPHYDPNDPTHIGPWYVVTRGRTVGVFRDQGVASASAVGFSHQNWFRANTYEAACGAFYRSALGNSVSDK